MRPTPFGCMRDFAGPVLCSSAGRGASGNDWREGNRVRSWELSEGQNLIVESAQSRPYGACVMNSDPRRGVEMQAPFLQRIFMTSKHVPIRIVYCFVCFIFGTSFVL